jgi:hypothetical protein
MWCGVQHLVMPWIVNLIYLLRLFPAPVMDFVSNALGVTKVLLSTPHPPCTFLFLAPPASHSLWVVCLQTMDEFQGRGWEATNPQTGKKEQ